MASYIFKTLGIALTLVMFLTNLDAKLPWQIRKVIENTAHFVNLPEPERKRAILEYHKEYQQVFQKATKSWMVLTPTTRKNRWGQFLQENPQVLEHMDVFAKDWDLRNTISRIKVKEKLLAEFPDSPNVVEEIYRTVNSESLNEWRIRVKAKIATVDGMESKIVELIKKSMAERKHQEQITKKQSESRTKGPMPENFKPSFSAEQQSIINSRVKEEVAARFESTLKSELDRMVKDRAKNFMKKENFNRSGGYFAKQNNEYIQRMVEQSNRKALVNYQMDEVRKQVREKLEQEVRKEVEKQMAEEIYRQGGQ